MPPNSGLDGLDDLLSTALEVRNGYAVVPNRPGLGLDWNWDAVDKVRECRLSGAEPPATTAGSRTPASADGPFSFPWDAPLVPPFPIRFRNVSILTAAWRTDADAIARLLPPPLEPTGDVVLAHIYSMPDVEFVGPAHECNVMFGARFERGRRSVQGGYSSGLYLDSDVGVAHGREVHGQPKKIAALKLETRGDLIVGEVSATASRSSRRPSHTSSGPPTCRHQSPLRLRREHQLQGDPAHRRDPRDQAADSAPPHRVVVHECWTGPSRSNSGPTRRRRCGGCQCSSRSRFFWRADFTLVAGRVLHDYLDGAGLMNAAPRGARCFFGDVDIESRSSRGATGSSRRCRRRVGRGHRGGRRHADGVLVRFGRSTGVIDACPGWRVIGRYGVGVDNVDVEAATSRGSPSSTCPTTASRRSRRTPPPARGWRRPRLSRELIDTGAGASGNPTAGPALSTSRSGSSGSGGSAVR